jgi:hypothetical protein
MSLFKSTGGKQQSDKGLSLLQGLGILAIIGIVAAIVINYFL